MNNKNYINKNEWIVRRLNSTAAFCFLAIVLPEFLCSSTSLLSGVGGVFTVAVLLRSLAIIYTFVVQRKAISYTPLLATTFAASAAALLTARTADQTCSLTTIFTATSIVLFLFYGL
jgi:hypothetical protein